MANGKWRVPGGRRGEGMGSHSAGGPWWLMSWGGQSSWLLDRSRTEPCLKALKYTACTTFPAEPIIYDFSLTLQRIPGHDNFGWKKEAWQEVRLSVLSPYHVC